MQYCSLQHQILLLSPVTSTARYCFCFGSIPSFFLELFLHWSPVAYWAHTDLGSSPFSILSFCLFILFMGFSRQEYWSGFPFPSPVDHILSECVVLSYLLIIIYHWASQVVLVVKNLPASAVDIRDKDSIPGLGRSPEEGKGNFTPVFFPGEPHRQRSLVGYSPWGHKESDTAECTGHTHHNWLCRRPLADGQIHFFWCKWSTGEGNG